MNNSETAQTTVTGERVDATVAARSAKGRLSRYTAVTVVAAPANQIIYALLLTVTPLSPAVNNVVAAVVVTGPTFLTYRLWVWPHQPTRRRQALWYWAFTALSVTTATAVAALVSHRDATTIELVIASLATYTAIWLIRFLWLDRVLFKHH